MDISHGAELGLPFLALVLFMRELLSERCEVGSLFVADFWIRQAERFEFRDDDTGNGHPREPFVVGWNDIPGR